ncbi:protein LAZY [Salix suchowensis]|nr:protein LAZY [Salix suchowensis]
MSTNLKMVQPLAGPCKMPSFDSRYGSRLLKQQNEECDNSFSDNEGEDENNREEASIISSDLFTAFSLLEPLAQNQLQNDLKLVNNELEKFLEAEAEDGGCNDSLARSSYVSTIRLSRMQMEATDAEDFGKTVAFPLQGYLSGSSIELPEIRFGVRKKKTKVTDEIPSENEVKGEMQAKKAHKSAKYSIKNILTKFHSTLGNHTPSAGDEASNSVSTKKKLIRSMDGAKCHKNNLKLPHYGHNCSNSRADGKY